MSIRGYDSWRLANPEDERGPDPYEDDEDSVDEPADPSDRAAEARHSDTPPALRALIDAVASAEGRLVEARERAANPLQVLELARHEHAEALAALMAAWRGE